MQNKLKIGWFTFSCCEDSTMIFIELLNDHYMKWKKVLDIKACLPLQKKEEIEDLDVSFVEGAITSKDQEEKLKKIRKNAKKLVAIGSCAVIGLPSSQRNQFDEKTKEEIQFILDRFKYAPKVQRLSEIVAVDEQVVGCPMNEAKFLEVLDKYLREFGIKKSE